MPRQPYPSALTRSQGRRLKPWLPAPKTCGRPRSVALREVVNAIRYVLRTGCSWRSRPHDGPCWQTVYGYFRTWPCGAAGPPSAAIIDSQSVKTTEVAGPRGYAAGQKVKGRKRHLVVDTLGLVLARLADRCPRLRLLWADGGYQGPKLGAWLAQRADWVLEIVRRPTDASGFQVLPRRWVVERTFAWLGPVAFQARRLSKDYEGRPETSEPWIQIAMIDRMLHRLGPA